MKITLKSRGEISLMAEAGRILATAHEEMRKAIRPGISTYELDQIGEKTMRSMGGNPACLGYEGYPAAVCISVNDEVVHGIPKKERILAEGDVVSLDTVVEYQGYHCDSARSYGVGQISPEAERLLRVTKESFFEGLKMCIPGNHIGDISRAVFDCVTRNGYGSVRALTGHGIGTSMHEEPNVPNFPTFFKGPKLRPGMVICIEPMNNLGTYDVNFSDDGWTVTTADGEISAHYENTVLITKNSPVILSRADGIEL